MGEETEEGPEGCLSIPGYRWDCRRHLHVVATGWNMHGDPVRVEGSELLARAIQHETDHLDGVLFVDRLDPRPAPPPWPSSRRPSGPAWPPTCPRRRRS